MKKAPSSSSSGTSNHNGNGTDAAAGLAIPWDRVAAYLPFSDTLSARLCCKDWLWQWRCLIGPDQCAAWLSALLQERNLYLAPDTTGNLWKSAAEATARQAEALERVFSPHRPNSMLQTPLDTETDTSSDMDAVPSSSSGAMDTLLRYLRVMHYLPQEVAVCYSGKSGRHCRPVVRAEAVQQGDEPKKQVSHSRYFPTKLFAYPPCHRGKRKNCPTCRVKIPVQPPNTRAEQEDDEEIDEEEEEIDEEEEEEERLPLRPLHPHPAIAHVAAFAAGFRPDPPRPPPPAGPPRFAAPHHAHGGGGGGLVAAAFGPPEPPQPAAAAAARPDPPPAGNHTLDDFYQIQKSSGEHLRLDAYFNKCIPNLPSNLTCPVCRVTNQRTLQLTEVTYQSAPGTERHEHVTMPLTFTPTDQEESENRDEENGTDDDDNVSMEDDGSSSEPEETTFPPIYQELFIPNTEEFLQPAEDCKTAISIHCGACRQFAVIAPAVACLNSRFPCHGKTMDTGDPAIVIGGILTRANCRVADCGCAALCRACSSLSKTMHYSRDTSSVEYRVLQCRHCKSRCCWLHERQNANCASCSDTNSVLTRRFTSRRQEGDGAAIVAEEEMVE
jgi:hypothetical protein